MKRIVFALLGASFLVFPRSVPAAAYDPDAIFEKARSLVESARAAEAKMEYESALKDYRRATKYLIFLRRKFPDYRPPEVNARGREYRKKISELEDTIYELPAGYVRVWPGMTRKGGRDARGSSLAPKVKKADENTYEVGEFTVKLVRAGPRIGASCSGPDFKYRGIDGDFACKHIWAVVTKEKLLEAKKKD